jgi:hypothetical protein
MGPSERHEEQLRVSEMASHGRWLPKILDQVEI